VKTFFAKLRDRQHLRKLNKEKQELLGRKPHWDDTRSRVSWLNAQLARAEKQNSLEEAERLRPLVFAAREEFRLLCGKGETR
jgi:hypothetical protein